MESYTLKGRVISNDQLPLKNLKVEAYTADPILEGFFLGQTVTDNYGMFEISLDSTKFEDFFGYHATPDIYILVKDNKNNQLLQARESKAEREMQYHIRHDSSTPNQKAPDPYTGNARRMLNILAEVGELIGIEYRINLDLLNKGDTSEDVRRKINEFVNGHLDRRYNFDQLIVVLNSLLNSLAEETRIGNIGYDGPQVPRFPRKESYHQVIVWPRQETFKWA